jgi:hypothetical protein
MIALIGCVKEKHIIAKAVRELYLSQLFVKTVRYVEKNNFSDWYVLSALHGLLAKDEVIEPYNLTLNTFSVSELQNWSKKVFHQIEQLKLNDVWFFCGEKYHNKFLLQLLTENNIQYTLPFLKMGLGQRLHFLTYETQIKPKGFFAMEDK